MMAERCAKKGFNGLIPGAWSTCTHKGCVKKLFLSVWECFLVLILFKYCEKK